MWLKALRQSLDSLVLVTEYAGQCTRICSTVHSTSVHVIDVQNPFFLAPKEAL